MLDAIGIISFFAVVVLVILAIISFFKKTKRVKKFLIGAGACLVIMVIAAVNAPTKDKPLTATTTEKASQNSQTQSPANTVSNNQTNATTSNPISSPTPAPTLSPQIEQPKPASQPDKKLISAKITKVVDGDTMDVSFMDGGKTRNERIRLLLVDTPETVDPDKPVQPFGPEASTFAKDTLNGKDVQLEIDVSERDKYGRLLCYLYIGDKMFNEMLLENGYARVAYVYPPNVKYIDKFREVQKTAQQKGINIWSVENYAQEDGFHENIVTAKEKPSPTPEPTVTPKPAPKPAPTPEPKAAPTPEPKVVTNSGSNNSNVYYKNCTEAKAAGAYNIKRGEPGYSSKLDRDNDGVACEK